MQLKRLSVLVIILGAMIGGVLIVEPFAEPPVVEENESEPVETSFVQFVSDIGSCSGSSVGNAEVTVSQLPEGSDVVQLDGSMIVTNTSYKSSSGEIEHSNGEVNITITDTVKQTSSQLSCLFAVPYESSIKVDGLNRPYTVRVIHDGFTRQVVESTTIE